MDTLLQVAAAWILPALFFWFLFSLITMTIIEFIQRFQKSRQKGLEEVLRKMMGRELTKEFYQHALVNPLEKVKPSYISQSLFAKVIMDWILPKTAAQPQTKKPAKTAVNKSIQNRIKPLAKKNAEFGDVLQTMLVQADMKSEKVSEFMDALQKDLEAWFLEAVNQMSPVYGARLQGKTLLVSLAVAVVANFDVISITLRLWETSKYTELLALAKETGDKVTIDPNTITMLPVGWYSNELPSTLTEWLLKIVGIYLGAFFIAIGSQYIYNLTKKQYRPAE
ncbi:MAG: Uncharacterized protein FD146_472 [Anaerolineaceae bacterium]|nr:MAG: Uncharacterized protein FD146_472 [Anaerolineaceae bacterium]